MTFDLDRAQMEAVLHDEGPALVLAGPGSGKTTVITRRAVRLSKKLSSPSRLLCVTFTNAAADEMRERYVKMASRGGGAYGNDTAEDKTPVFCTVHSFCNGIVKEFERISGKRYTRIEGEDSPRNAILSRIYKKFNGSVPDDAMLERLKGYFRREKEAGKADCSDGNAPKAPSGANQIRRFRDIEREYVRVKAENGYLDFDDMIFLSLKILRENADIRERMQCAFDFIQVDEAQDLSRAQYDVIRAVSGNDNIFIVADDDQSIYGFRSAEPQCLFDFAEEFPDAARYELTRNFRSEPGIVEASSALVSVNVKRFRKDLFTTRESSGESVFFETHRSAAAQGIFCAEEARDAVRSGETIAVLYRNGISSLPVRAALMLSGVKYGIAGNCPRAWEQPAVRECFEKLLEAERNAKFIVPGPSATYRALIRDGFAGKMEELCRLEGHDRKTVSVTLDFLKLITERSGSYLEAVGMLDKIERFDGAFLNGQCGEGAGPHVMLSTIHSAKGLEYDRVIVIDVLEGELPGSEAVGDAVEEERRLLYVAMTRAKRKLILSRPVRRGIRGEEDSRFLKEAVCRDGKKGSGTQLKLCTAMEKRDRVHS
ncbi:MAG: ATP-dependent helicase [Clostridia bacterium]|nr:ATP-dependent helicase [Clostridia bacterium]